VRLWSCECLSGKSSRAKFREKENDAPSPPERGFYQSHSKPATGQLPIARRSLRESWSPVKLGGEIVDPDRVSNLRSGMLHESARFRTGLEKCLDPGPKRRRRLRTLRRADASGGAFLKICRSVIAVVIASSSYVIAREITSHKVCEFLSEAATDSPSPRGRGPG